METNTNQQNNTTQTPNQEPTKFCKFCGGKIAEQAVICPLCGRQVEEIKGNQQAPQPVVINNTNNNVATATAVAGGVGRARSKWVALLLCIFLGLIGAHKFYEGKVGMGILYIFTGGLFGIGALIDLICIIFKPNPYYV